MKKIVLSALVLIGFLGYMLSVRGKSASQMPIATPSPRMIPPTAAPQSSGLQPMTVSTTQPSAAPQPVSGYKDGVFVGDAADAFYGNIQVQATITNGKIANVQFLQYPNDRDTSISINQQADPMLAQEAIQAQNANVNIISGATDSSQAFIQSLQSALNKAKS